MRLVTKLCGCPFAEGLSPQTPEIISASCPSPGRRAGGVHRQDRPLGGGTAAQGGRGRGVAAQGESAGAGAQGGPCRGSRKMARGQAGGGQAGGSCRKPRDVSQCSASPSCAA